MTRTPDRPPRTGKDLINAAKLRRDWWAMILRREPATVRLLRDATAEAQRSKLPQMAAALSYRTIFGLIPVMVVALIALKFFTSESDLTDAINRAMQYSGLSQISVSEQQANMGPFPEELEGVPAAAATAESNPAPGATHTSTLRLDGWIKDLVARVSEVNFRAIGIIGIMALLYAAISMLVEVERAFNQIYCVPVGRSWLRRILNYWFLLTVGAGGLFGTFFVGQQFSAKLVQVAAWAGANSGSTVLLALVGYLTTTMISTLLFLVLYLVMPNTRVKAWPALCGAFVAALCWEAGKWGFTEYLRFSTGYAKLYGSIALVPLFLLWVYVTWCIVLAGLNIAYFLQHGRHKTMAHPVRQINPGVVDPGSAIGVAAALAGHFERGEPADAPVLARSLCIQDGIVQQMLDRLVDAGVALKVRHKDEDGYYTLARPAHRISAEEVLRIGEELIAQPAVGTVSEAMCSARREAVRGKSVEDFAAQTAPHTLQSPNNSRAPGAVPGPLPG